MKARGGYNVRLAGPPPDTVEKLSLPEELCLPLKSRRFEFGDVAVKDGDKVKIGQVLARDTGNFGVPLLAPSAGTIKLAKGAQYVEIVELAGDGEQAPLPALSEEEAGAEGLDRVAMHKLLDFGAWQFAVDARTGGLPDPGCAPGAMIVSVARAEPYLAASSVLLRDSLKALAKGVDLLCELVPDCKVFVILPRGLSDLNTNVRDVLESNSRVQIETVPAKYPHGDVRLAARALRLTKSTDKPIWGFGVAGILAVEQALAQGRAVVTRVISLAGSAVDNPRHLELTPGHPLLDLVAKNKTVEQVRTIAGGLMTGTVVDERCPGLDVESEGVTVIEEYTKPVMLSFARPGWSLSSITRCFLSAVRPAFLQKYDSSLNGEVRACVLCGFCEEVCPAGIMPNMIHRFLYQDAIEDAERMRLDLCIECGLCSFVCPSKIELRQQFHDALETIRGELATEEVGK